MLLRRPDVLERNAAFLGVRTGEGPHRASIPRRLLMGACHCDVCVAPWCQRRCVCSRRIRPLLCPLCVALAEVASGRDSEVGCRPDLSDLEPHSSGQAVSFQRRCFIFQSRRPGWGFPGGCLVKNPPAPWGHVPWVRSLIHEAPTCYGATKLLCPATCGLDRSPCQRKPTHRNQSGPHSPQ